MTFLTVCDLESLKVRMLLSLGYGCGLRAGYVIRGPDRRHYGAEKPALVRFAAGAASVILGRGVKTLT